MASLQVLVFEKTRKLRFTAWQRKGQRTLRAPCITPLLPVASPAMTRTQAPIAVTRSALVDGRATLEATKRFSKRFAKTHGDPFYRELADGPLVSSLGLGTYLGECDDTEDARYTAAAAAARQSTFFMNRYPLLEIDEVVWVASSEPCGAVSCLPQTVDWCHLAKSNRLVASERRSISTIRRWR